MVWVCVYGEGEGGMIHGTCWMLTFMDGAVVVDADSGQDMTEFNWDDYLEETGAVPHHAFKHVSLHHMHILAKQVSGWNAFACRIVHTEA